MVIDSQAMTSDDAAGEEKKTELAVANGYYSYSR